MVAVVSAMGKTTDDLIHLADSVSSVQPPREYDMLVSTGERISMSLLCMALAELGVDAASFTGQPGRHHHRQRPHPGQDPRGQGRPPARGPGGRSGPGGGRLPGRVDRARDHHAGSGRLRRHRRGPGGRPRAPTPARSTPTSPGCSPPTRGSCPTAHRINRISFEEMLEIAATGGRVLMLRSVEFARNHNVPAARAHQFHLGARHLGRRGGCRHGRGRRHRGDPRHHRGQGDRERRARPSRRGGQALPGPGRPLDQRRHDRPERLGPRHHRHLLHRAQDRPGRLGGDGAGHARTSWGPRA